MIRPALVAVCTACALAAGGVVGAARAGTMTIEQALTRTYESNPVLQSARAQLAAVDEGVPEALAARRPTLSALASLGPLREHQTIHGGNWQEEKFRYRQRTAEIDIHQPLFHGGALAADVAAAEARVRAQRAQLRATEASVLLKAAQAFADVVLRQRLLVIARAYQAELGRLASGLKKVFANQDTTRTALAQTEARLADAKSRTAAAEAQLSDAEAAFLETVGVAPQDLGAPSLPTGLPGSAEQARAEARRAAPAVIGAKFLHQAARAEVTSARAAHLPQVDVTAFGRLTRDAAAGTPVADQYSLAATVAQPIYRGGGLSAAVRVARAGAEEAGHQTAVSRRDAERTAGDTWADYASAVRSVTLRRRQLASARLAYEGQLRLIAAQQRPVMDALDTLRELQQVETEQAQAEHDRFVDAYALLAATGTLTAERLKLPTRYYDPVAHYRHARGQLLDPPFQW